MDSAAHNIPHPLQESSRQVYTSAPVQSAIQQFTQSFCQVGASVEEISLDDSGSCQGRCGALNTMNKQQGLCSCDSACMVYGDCCWDFQQECPALHERAVNICNVFDIAPSSTCFTVEAEGFWIEKVLLINSCERMIYGHPEITSTPDPHTQIPVLDLDTGIFYINFKCAICNGAQRLQATEIHLNYRIPENNKIKKINQSDETKAPRAFSTADEVVEAMEIHPYISYSFPGAPARLCLSDVVDQCDETCDNRDLIDLCRTGGQSYTLDPFQGDHYHNIYCALCNFISVEQLQYSESAPPRSALEVADLVTASLSFHFDLQELESPSVDPVSLHCKSDRIALPDGVVCGERICPKGYTLHLDTCRANHVSVKSINWQPVANATHLDEPQFVSPCEGVRLPKSEFAIENGSLILTSNGRIYKEGEYIMENASAVICQNSTYTDFSARGALGITTIILCLISLLGLICRLILQPFWQQYNSFPGRMQFNLVLAMALSISLLLLSPMANVVDKLCFILGVLKYFSFLASFVWMTCVAGDTCWALRRIRAAQHSQKGPGLLWYLLIGWLLPLVMTIILLAIDLSEVDTSLAPQFGGRGCWITEKVPMILFFFVPFVLSVTSNIVFFLLTVRFLKTSFQESGVLQKSKNSQHPWQVYVKLFIIMGLSWLVGCVAIWVDSIVVWFLFVILNASQGIFIFMAFVVKLSKLKTICWRHDPAPVSVKRFLSHHTEPIQTTELRPEAVVTMAMTT